MNRRILAFGMALAVSLAGWGFSPAAAYGKTLLPASYTLVKQGGELYCVDASGSRATGWQTVKGKTYYFGKDGAAVTDPCIIGGKWCEFLSDGSLDQEASGPYTGWASSSGGRCFYKEGVKLTGWQRFSEGLRYFGEPDGKMAVGTVEIDGKSYTFSQKGFWDGVSEPGAYSAAYSKLQKQLSKDDYGGIYAYGGGLVVVTKNRDQVQPVVEELQKGFSPIMMKSRPFSVKELEQVKAQLKQNAKAFRISSYETDVVNNRIHLMVKEETPQLKDFVESLKDPRILLVEEGTEELIDE